MRKYMPMVEPVETIKLVKILLPRWKDVVGLLSWTTTMYMDAKTVYVMMIEYMTKLDMYIFLALRRESIAFHVDELGNE